MTQAKVNHVPLGLVDGPFHARLEPLSRARAWVGWDGYASPAVLDTMEFEYFAIRNQATLFDISPMRKYRVTGPDALAVMNRVVTRDVARLGDGRVGYALWCDEEGMVIDDGTVFRVSDTDFRLCCQERMFSWLNDAAWGFEASVADESDAVAGLALQGPTAWSVLNDTGFDVADLKPFDFREVERDVWISRTGFTGDLGYEVWMPRDAALKLWDRLWEAGRPWGLRAIGSDALNLARIEAGYLAARVDFQPVHGALRLHRGRTPLELGMERLVHWDKGHFNGRRALLKAREEGPRTRLLRLDVGGFKPATDALVYFGKGREVGHVTSAAWSPTTKRNIALAEVRAPYASGRDGGLRVEIYVHQEGRWERRMMPATPVKGPFFNNPRARQTPPAPF